MFTFDISGFTKNGASHPQRWLASFLLFFLCDENPRKRLTLARVRIRRALCFCLFCRTLGSDSRRGHQRKKALFMSAFLRCRFLPKHEDSVLPAKRMGSHSQPVVRQVYLPGAGRGIFAAGEIPVGVTKNEASRPQRWLASFLFSDPGMICYLLLIKS